MKKEIMRPWKDLILPMLLLFAVMIPNRSDAQQHIINKKDNTRPETAREYNGFNLASFNVIQQDGYNEVKWQVDPRSMGSKFIVEYSFDGVNFIQGGQVLAGNGLYNYRHYIRDTRPLLYRVRTEDNTGALSFSGAILPKGVNVSPVQLQKNVVEGNVINVTAQFPVERLTIVSGNGLQLFAKDVNGMRDFIPIAIPSLDKGVYLITFYGNGWQSTSRFVVG